MDIHDRSEPDDGRKHMEIADDEADDVPARGQRPVPAFGLQLVKELLAAVSERAAADDVDVAPGTFEPGLSRVIRCGGSAYREQQEQHDKGVSCQGIARMRGPDSIHIVIIDTPSLFVNYDNANLSGGIQGRGGRSVWEGYSGLSASFHDQRHPFPIVIAL